MYVSPVSFCTDLSYLVDCWREGEGNWLEKEIRFSSALSERKKKVMRMRVDIVLMISILKLYIEILI